MKKAVIISAIIFVLLQLYLLISEGTEWGRPKVFYADDKNATYTISVDDSNGFYFLEGTNSFPFKRPFKLVIVLSQYNLESYINRTVRVEGFTEWADNLSPLCRRGWEKWCSEYKIGHVPGYFIEKITLVK